MIRKIFPKWDEFKPEIQVAVISAIITLVVGFLGATANVISALIQRPIPVTPPPVLTSTVTVTSTIQPPTALPIQTQSPSPTITATGAPHTVRFVVSSIPTDKVHNLYYSVDGSQPIHWSTLGSKFDSQKSINFSSSIRVWIDIAPETLLDQQLFVDGKQRSSKKTNNAGLTYTVKDRP